MYPIYFAQVSFVGLNATETRLELTHMYDYLESEFSKGSNSAVVDSLRPFQVACQKRRHFCQKRPNIYQKRPTEDQKRPVKTSLRS